MPLNLDSADASPEDADSDPTGLRWDQELCISNSSQVPAAQLEQKGARRQKRRKNAERKKEINSDVMH